MQLKDATRNFGSVGLLLPLILILMAADSALACPGNKTGVVYRTRAVNSRTVSLMQPTVITYRAPASYGRCANNVYTTQGTRYVAVRRNAVRYVAVRSDDGLRSFGRHRYGAVYDVDYGLARREAARYVAVRRPVYVDSGTRYVAVRNPRTRYVAVRDIDYDDVDTPRYVAVRRYPVYDTGTRYVAVRNYMPRTRYVVRDIDIDDDAPRYVAVRNVRNACACDIGLRSSLDEIETVRPKHVVVKSDLLAGTEEVVYSGMDNDTAEYIAPSSENVVTTSNIAYMPASYAVGNGVTYIADNDMVSPYGRHVAARIYPEAVTTRTISYVPASNYEDFDDQAILDEGGATYVAADDIEDACLSRVSYRASPVVVSTRAVNYVPVEDVEDEAFLSGSDATYIATEAAAPRPRYVALDDDGVFNDLDPTYVAANDVEDSCSCPVAFHALDNDVDVDTVSYVPVEDIDDVDAETISYVPAESVGYAPAESVSYVPAEHINVRTASYVPADNVEYIEAADNAADDCVMLTNNVDSEPVYVANDSTVFVEDTDARLVAELNGTQQIAGNFGYRDGFEDGKDAALESDVYHPENSGDFRKATEGYEDTFGDKDVYKDAYRSSYLDGYRAGFESAAGSL